MRVFTSVCLVLVALLLSGPRSAVAQSLGDLAKQQAERRKNVKDEGKVLTNKDVPAVPQSALTDTPPPPADPAAAPSQPAAAAGDDQKKPADAGAAASETDKVQDEKYWAGRKKALQEQLDRDQTLLAALQSRVNALTTDFVNRDDPAQRATISVDRQKALDEIGKMTSTITADKKAITDLEDQARRANVPAGWLR
jgi:hypothetical protein